MCCTAEWMSKRSGSTTINETRTSSGENWNAQGTSSSENTSTGPAERRFLLPQELMSMQPGTGRIWTPGAGNSSIPFFAPVYWRRAELRGLYDDNPYFEGTPAASSPGSSSSSSWVNPSRQQRGTSPPRAGSDFPGWLWVAAAIVAVAVFFLVLQPNVRGASPKPAVQNHTSSPEIEPGMRAFCSSSGKSAPDWCRKYR